MKNSSSLLWLIFRTENFYFVGNKLIKNFRNKIALSFGKNSEFDRLQERRVYLTSKIRKITEMAFLL